MAFAFLGHRCLNTTADSSFDIFCFEKLAPLKTNESYKGVQVPGSLASVPKVEDISSSMRDDLLYLSWSGFCSAMEDETKLRFVAGLVLLQQYYYISILIVLHLHGRSRCSDEVYSERDNLCG